MKKFLFVLGVIFSLSLTSCSSVEDKLQKPEQVSMETQEIKQGVVHRVFQRDHRIWTVFSVRLTDGNILSGFCCDKDNYENKQIKDFFFAQPGDTIVYSGEKVLEVKFKD